MDDIIKFIKKFLAKIRDDDVGAYAGQSTLFIMMSFFPFVVSVFTIMHYLPIGTEDTVISLLTSALPENLKETATGLLKEIEQAASGGVIITTLIMGLWAASRGFMSIITGLNCIYGMRESRGYFKLRGISLVYTLLFIPASVITLVLMVYGKVIINNVQSTLKGPGFEIFFKIFNVGTWLTEVMLFLFFWALFTFVPNHRKHPLRELPGAMITTVVWVIFSDIYYVFYSTSTNLSALYGSLAVIILFVLWLYFCMYIVFVGAEINTELYEILELRNIYKK